MYNITTPYLSFEWDERKNQTNLLKHGITFEEAVYAFLDDCGLVISDPDHSTEEERFILLGMTNRRRLLVIVHCLRDNDTIRIISARKATANEEKQYANQRTR